MKLEAQPLPVNKSKRLCLGHTVIALVPLDPMLVNGPVGAFPAICVHTGSEGVDPGFDLLGLPPLVLNMDGQQVAISPLVRKQLKYMGKLYIRDGWCWPEEWVPPNDGIKPSLLVH